MTEYEIADLLNSFLDTPPDKIDCATIEKMQIYIRSRVEILVADLLPPHYYDPDPNQPTILHAQTALNGDPEIAANLMEYIATTDQEDIDPDVIEYYIRGAAAKITRNLRQGKAPGADRAFGLTRPNTRDIDKIMRYSDICTKIENLRRNGATRDEAIAAVAVEIDRKRDTVEDIYKAHKAWATPKGRLKAFLRQDNGG